MMEKCPVCGRGKLTPVNNTGTKIESHTFVEVGERCDSCGEEFIPEEVAQRATPLKDGDALMLL